MKLLLFLSNTIIPLLIFYIVGTGLLQKQNIYEEFIRLMVAVGILRASGLLDAVSSVFSNIISSKMIPGEIIPVFVVRLFSNSAATGLVLDIFKKYGTDSMLGYISSIMMSSTETVFYTMSVYFMSAKIKKTRWTLSGAMLATIAGTIASVLLAKQLQ